MRIEKTKTFTLLISIALVASVSLVVLKSQPVLGNEAGSLGKVTVDSNVSEWNVGSGQFNGEFITAEVQGIQLGLRAQERFAGLLDVTGDRGDRVGVYEATVGSTGPDNNGTWNYDWHVDLSNATGNAAGKTLEDYKLVLEQNFTTQSLFGLLGFDPVILPMGATCDPFTLTTTLCQQSWNPGFGNTDYDPFATGSYNLRMVLTPETFNGPALAVVIRVNVN